MGRAKIWRKHLLPGQLAKYDALAVLLQQHRAPSAVFRFGLALPEVSEQTLLVYNYAGR